MEYWNKGKKCPQISKGRKGVIPWNKGEKTKIYCSQCGKEFLVHPYRKETTSFCSVKCKGLWMRSLKGEKAPGWIDGRTPENHRIRNGIETRLWRETVFSRDNYTCQKYGIRGGKLEAHHIKNFADYPELRFAIDNGITLSEKAHDEFHKIYGKRNNTMEQLKEFLKVGKN